MLEEGPGGKSQIHKMPLGFVERNWSQDELSGWSLMTKALQENVTKCKKPCVTWVPFLIILYMPWEGTKMMSWRICNLIPGLKGLRNFCFNLK